MNVLVTGGAGYIGSHVVKALGPLGFNITVYDNLSTGFREAVTYGELVIGDLSDQKKLQQLFETKKFDAVLHFAGSIVVPDSVKWPLAYYENNTINSHFLLTLCEKFKVNQFIFSSTAAVYGISDSGICSEESPVAPINPYGHSKYMTELMLKDFSKTSSFRYVALRYFNVSGADPEGKIGQSFPKATHLIKAACEAATNKREKLELFGTDYATPDGTCVRDYIHVSDLADAHVKALLYLKSGGSSQVLNCGYGKGFSVREVINKVKEITGANFKVEEKSRRDGDSPKLIAKADLIQKIIGWTPKYNSLDLIVKTAFEWEKNRKY